MSEREIVMIILTVLLAPVAGGLLAGVDRIITARMQGRYGPPLLQPFYDAGKLLNKENIISKPEQFIYAALFLIFNIVSLVMFVLKMDLLLILFVLTFAIIALIMGAMSVNSPYAQIGAQRELIAMLAYEPILIAVVVGVYFTTGSFRIEDVLQHPNMLIWEMPLLFLAFTYVLTIKLRKSPFDISTSHHGHQELVKGLTTEYSGFTLGLIEIGHWYETVLLLFFGGLFFATNYYIAVVAVLVAYFAEILVDNISARLTWQTMLNMSWTYGLSMAVANLVWVYIKHVG